MKHITPILLFVIVAVGVQCARQSNPFFQEYKTKLGIPPFNKIKLSHYMPAYTTGMADQKIEIDAIVNNPAEPTFENTVEALEYSGGLLTKVKNVFENLNSSNTNDDMQAIAKQVAPLLSKHNDDILMNPVLFKRINAVYQQKDALELSTEQAKLLDDTYKAFVRGGANLNDDQKAELRKINEELAVLTLKFGENVLKETNKFELVIDDSADLAGLPEASITGAAETADERGYENKWVFTIQKPSMIPFLQYSEKRELREKIFRAYMNQGDNNDDLDNKAILKKIASLRVKRANLLGYKTHADYVLEENMAKAPANVYDLLNKLWTPALNMAKKEVYDMQTMIDDEGGNFRLKPWDWWYYAEKVKKDKYDLDESMLRPFFELENVRNGAYAVATKLYGITFTELKNAPTYHKDVKVFDVNDADGSLIGVLLVDYFPRASKRGGAWMSEFRNQHKKNGQNIRPIIVNVGNFSKPTADQPALLSWDEVNTLFHEFGHALHGLLSQCTYSSESGTNVSRDFVELPSQIMENWAAEPEVMKMYFRHYKTDEPIPDELIEKIQKSKYFNQGFETVEYLAASFLDMDWHTLTDTTKQSTIPFENASMKKIALIPEIIPRYRSTYFRHVFGGGYSSGYYSYIWAEWLDADAFEAFKETGNIFDPNTATSFRKNILERGGSDDPMKLYRQFRGADPKIEPLLKRRGLAM
ncbi:M3 family metallopeptidase [candidate division KSB1 bacterium]|nr:M3 family metallopeptidase [candidate division KSB1 bacterium]